MTSDETLDEMTRRLARDIVVLAPEEYQRGCRIPGTIARPASLEGKVLYESAA